MSDQKRYLVITELFLPTKGGTAIWFDEVYSRIGGKEIHIVTADVGGAAEYDAKHNNSVHRVSLRRHWWLRPESLAMYIKLFAKSLRIGLGNKFDAVHAGRVLPEGLVGLVVARIIRRPLVVYAHGEEITTWRAPGKFKVMKYVYRHADRVIANSGFTRDELLKLGVSSKRITLIYPGVDVDRFRPDLPIDDLLRQLSISNKQRLILSVGRLSRRKGFDQLIRSLPSICEQGIDAHYALIGIGEDMEYLKQLSHELGVSERVHFLGHVPAEDLPRWYCAADVFAMPNREVDNDTEGFGIVFLEAAACAKPVIAGNSGGTGSAVIEGETGLRVDGQKTKEVADALLKILGDSEYSGTLSKNGYERVQKEFAWDKVVEKTLQLGF